MKIILDTAKGYLMDICSCVFATRNLWVFGLCYVNKSGSSPTARYIIWIIDNYFVKDLAFTYWSVRLHVIKDEKISTIQHILRNIVMIVTGFY